MTKSAHTSKSTTAREYLTSTCVSSSRSLLLHLPKNSSPSSPSENQNNPAKKSKLFPLNQQRGYQFRKQRKEGNKKKRKEMRIASPSHKDSSSLFRTSPVPLKSPETSASSLEFQCVHKAKAWRVQRGRNPQIPSACLGSERVHAGVHLCTFSSPTSAAGQAELSRLRPFLYWNPN